MKKEKYSCLHFAYANYLKLLIHLTKSTLTMIKRFFTLSFFAVIVSTMYGTHNTGIEMYAECLNTCTYRIHHKTFLNCGSLGTLPPAPTLAPNIIFQGSPSGCVVSPQIIGNWVFVQHVEITPVCPSMLGSTTCATSGGTILGVSEAHFYADYDICNNGTLPNCQELIISDFVCCRNSAVSSGSANEGIYLEIRVALDSGVCNQSPVFTHPPKTMICAGNTNTMDFGATDAEGDSLVYSLTSCYQNINTPVSYIFGYSGQNFLGQGWNTSIDPTSGLVTMVPINNFATAITVVCVTVDEYRNGVHIGSISRDFILTVVNCPGFTPLNIDTIQNISGAILNGQDTLDACPQNPVSFEIVAADSNSLNNITISSDITDSFSGAIAIQTGNNPAVYQVSFIPDSQTIGNSYQIQVNIEDDECPLPAQITKTIVINVGPNCIIPQITSTACSATNGAIDISLPFATPPVQYLWSTGDTTEDISGLSSGIYWVTATDSLGIVYSDTFVVGGSDIIITDSLVKPSCDVSDGAIYTSVTGGVAPYTYSWTNGAATTDIFNLAPGGYTIYVTDSTGCINHSPLILGSPDSCFVLVEGRAYIDQNNNCIFDAGDFPLQNAYIDFTPGGAVLTDTNGIYSFMADTGSLSVSYINSAHPAALCGPGNIQTLSFSSYDEDTMGVDFPIDTIVANDLQISGVTTGNVSPGFLHYYTLAYTNNGTVPMSGTITLALDPNAGYVSSFPVGIYDSTLHIIIWNFSNLAPGNLKYLFVSATIPFSVPISTPISTTATITPITGDFNPANNTYSWPNQVGQAFDPNDKQVIPQGIGAQGFIQRTDSILNYTIRFQNTGTLPATFVIIEDSIDEDLEITSLSMGGASHPYSVMIEQDQKLVITFNNINLPDSASAPDGSQGFVQFSLKQKPDLPIGTEITNQVGIIFDFNEPVITNQVINTIFDYPGVEIANAPDSLCVGDSLTALITNPAMPPYTYQWQPINQNQTTSDSVNVAVVTTSDFYKVIVTDAFGFKDSATTQYLHATPQPVADFSFQTNIGTVDFTNLSQHNDTLQWDFGDSTYSTDENPQHTYSANGSYVVKLITKNTCGADTISQVVEIGSVSIFEPLNQDNFAKSVRIAPNPFSEAVKISFDNPAHSLVELTLIDTRGRTVVYQKPERTSSFTIQNQGLAPGIYLVKITGPGQFMGKIMVE